MSGGGSGSGSGSRPALSRHIRKNSHPSPTSPSFPRRYNDRPRYSDSFSPSELTSATTASSDSPTIEVQLPSPGLDVSLGGPGPALQQQQQQPTRRGTAEKPFDNHVPRRPNLLAGPGRPYTTDAVNQHTHYPPNESHSLIPPYKLSPAIPSPRFVGAAGRSSSEFSPRLSESVSPSLRGWNQSPQMLSRGFSDDQSKIPAQKKSRLNLLNPMSLLARRRTSQAQNETSDLTINTMHVPAMPADFNPSIRGTITHDFSAPRSRRTPSYGDASQMEKFRKELPHSATLPFDTFSPSPRLHPLSANTNTSGHSPMFKEHFQDDRQPLRPEQTGYLHSAALNQRPPDTQLLDANMPAFARRLPVQIPEQDRVSLSKQGLLQTDLDRPLPLAPMASPPPPPPPPKHTPPLPPPERDAPSPPRQQRTPSPPINISQPSTLPKHMTSTSSRFSFQIGGQASSTQEKLLEEKHKQFQDAKRVSSLSREVGMDDDYDYDADAGFEEEIPEFGFDEDDGFGNTTVFDRSKIEMSTSTLRPQQTQHWHDDGAFGEEDDDLTFDRSKIENATSTQRPPPLQPWPKEDDGFGGDDEPTYDRSKVEMSTSTHAHAPGMQDFHFTPDSLTFSPLSSNHLSQATPTDESGTAIGVADSSHIRVQSAGDLQQATELLGGLGISTRNSMSDKPVPISRQSHGFDDVDIYFDDGEFGGDFGGPTENGAFNEDMLDDESAIRDIPAENMRRFQAAQEAAGMQGRVEISSSNFAEDIDARDRRSVSFDESESRKQKRESQATSVVAGLTEGNLAAYHDLLANAAHEAAAKGKFNRISFSQDSEDDSHPGIISDESRLSNNMGGSGIAYDDGFPFDDDDVDDEMMIAAANADALENDDDGFYGQEFGFYARARTKENLPMVNGGFFANRGDNGVKRSHSGRANFQEPSLTPITERSEWSTRNSVASLQIPGGIPGSAQSLPSPGIAQLLERDSPVHDDDMTLSALMKLRRGAFGGSSTSVSSLGGGHTGSSPLAQHYSNPFPAQDSIHGRMASSIHSMPASAGIPESEEEDYLTGDEPTITQNTPNKKIAEPHVMPLQENRAMSPIMASGGSKKSNHSRASSGADSVSYMRDSDGRWLLERRRTGEDGVPEVDREYLAAGARI
jgi:hypothetical protein